MSDDTTFDSLNDDSPGPSADSRDKVRRVAKYQRVVIFAIIANIVVNIVSLSARELPPLAALGLLFLILCVVAVAIAAVFLLSRELYSVGVAVLCAVLMIVPCISLITLLIVNQSATSFLQRNGVKVGFLGTDPNSIT